MKKELIIILIFTSITLQAQMTWEFTNKLYIKDNSGNVDSVSFGNNFGATLGIDNNFHEQNIIQTKWDSLEIRSIQRSSDSIDCPVNYWGNIFTNDIDLKTDIRESNSYPSCIFFVFKINAIHYPIKVFSDFSEMFNNSLYNSWSVILKHQFECKNGDYAACLRDYHQIFTLNDSTERYITVRLDYETGVNDLQNKHSIMNVNNPVDDLITLNYDGRIQIYNSTGKLELDRNIIKSEKINVQHFVAGLYLIKTSYGGIKMIKK